MHATVVRFQRPHRPREKRVIYELARLRLAETRNPPKRLAHLVRSHD